MRPGAGHARRDENRDKMRTSDTPADFGEWLQRRRKLLDLTQENLGRLAGCSGAAIRKFEAGERRPSLELADALARVLQIPDQEREAFLQLARGSLYASPPPVELSAFSPRPAAAPVENLPAPLTSLVDRVQAAREVAELLTDGAVRWVTLIGPPGIGKTRLSIQSARQVLAHFREGVWFVDLAPLEHASHVLPALARALAPLGLPASPDLEQLSAALRQDCLLLVLDNFEHLTDAAAEIAALLKACPEVKVLATSRIPLYIYGEHEYRVPPLSVPPAEAVRQPESLMQYESVQLFVARARQQQRDFSITAENAAHIFEVCATLGGLPLALELAAASLPRIPLAAMAGIFRSLEGESWIQLLGTPARDLPARQRTLENVVTWSYDLLDEPLRSMFCRLGLFAGWFDLEAVLAVCFDEPRPSPLKANELITALAEHSLLTRERVGGLTGWRMLEVIREYALLRLASSEREQRSAQFAQYYFEKARAAASGDFDLFKTHADNFLAALKYFVVHQQTETGFQMTASLSALWSNLGYYREGLDLLRKLFTFPDSAAPEIRANRLQDASDLAWQVYDFETSLAFAREAADLGRAFSLPGREIMYFNRLGRINIERGQYAEARRALETCLSLVSDDPSALNPGIPLAQLGELAMFEGRHDDARLALEAALQQIPAEQKVFISMAAVDLAEISLASGDPDRSLDWLRRAYPLVDVNMRRSIVFLCAAAGYLVQVPSGGSRSLHCAARLYGSIDHLSERSGVRLGSFYGMLNQKRISQVRASISRDAWNREYQAGAAWGDKQALAAAADCLNIAS